nr:ferrous iron transporter B [Saprospiraceae bacterium]
ISYMLDRLMRKFGLSGKAVVPMMSGFACAIPAIMATRNIKSWKERLITIMVTPLMSCSARLPVYILLIGMLVPAKKIMGVFNLQGLTMTAFYYVGLVVALIIAGILSYFLKVEEQTPFILEMPRYRVPQWRNVVITMYKKAKVFAVEAGKVILVISIILWLLQSYGPKAKMAAIEDKYEQLANGEAIEGALLKNYEQERLNASYAGHIGQFIEPVIKPLGYDWKIGISLITSFAAREVFVGTMATLYSVDVDEENPKNLQERLLAEKDPETGRQVYSFATVFSLLLFYAFAMQCMATLAVVYRETKSWKWPIIQLIYLTTLAYGLSFIAYQILK